MGHDGIYECSHGPILSCAALFCWIYHPENSHRRTITLIGPCIQLCLWIELYYCALSHPGSHMGDYPQLGDMCCAPPFILTLHQKTFLTHLLHAP